MRNSFISRILLALLLANNIAWIIHIPVVFILSVALGVGVPWAVLVLMYIYNLIFYKKASLYVLAFLGIVYNGIVLIIISPFEGASPYLENNIYLSFIVVLVELIHHYNTKGKKTTTNCIL